MLQWRLDQTLPPPLRHKSAQHRLSECERREKSFQISQLIAGVSKRGEKAWVWPIPQCVRTATPTHSTAQHSHDTAAASRKLRMAVRLQSPRAVGIYIRHRSPREPSALYCSLFFKWQTLSSNSVAERSIQSMFNRQVTDGDVIGKAVSNEPVRRSYRAFIRGLLLGLAPLTLGNTL